MKYERLTEREAPLVMTLYEATKVYNRLIELENKIESEELVDRDYIARLRHRAEVAERALLSACVRLVKDEADSVNIELLARVVYMCYLANAEKED